MKIYLFSFILFLVLINFAKADSVGLKENVINGTVTRSYLGYSVAYAGDVNRDGYGDIIIGAYNASSTGMAFIFFGSSNGIPSLNTSDANVTFVGEASGDKFGYSVSGAGDVNNDTYDDVIIGAYLNDEGGTDAGKVYIFFGATTMDNVSDVNITGVTGGFGDRTGQLGYSVSSAGDFNRDGYGDVLVGSPAATSMFMTVGRIDIFFGNSTMNNEADVRIVGEVDNGIGTKLSSAGDFNRDGYGDVIFNTADKVYVIFGSINVEGSVLSLTDMNITITGLSTGKGILFSLSSADVNNDTYDDVIIGSAFEGKVYIFYGSLQPPSTWGGADANATLNGTVESFGYAVASAGDVNSDGISDIIIGDPSVTPERVFIFYGNTLGIVSGNSTNLADMIINSPSSSNDEFGYSVSGGDVTNDTFSNVIVGARLGSPRGISAAGQVYTYYPIMKLTQVECNVNNTVWRKCSNVSFYDNITQVRINCTSTNSLTNATFKLENIPDGTTFFTTNNATSVSGNLWIFDNSDLNISDSGEFQLTSSCIDNTSLEAKDKFRWVVPWGSLSASLITPDSNTNVVKDDSFTFKTSLRCLLGECGYVNATLKANGTVSTSTGATPFYTTSNNPQTCSDMKLNNVCTTNWTVFSTGSANTYWEMYTLYNSTNYSSSIATNETTRINITIKLADKGSCSSNNECLNGYCVHSICRSTRTFCGDRFCDSNLDETSASCPEDCGPSSVVITQPGIGLVFAEIKPNEIASIKIEKSIIDFTDVTEISISVYNPVQSAKLTITKIEKEPAEIVRKVIQETEGSVYSYLNITAKNINEEDTQNATISFRVEKVWLTNNSLDKDSVMLNRFHDDKWENLPTKMTNSSSEYYEYKAVTKGFSIFAITAEKIAVCGNNIKEKDEQCDSFDLANETCTSLGFVGGTLSCNSDCTFNFDACISQEEQKPVCGNRICEFRETTENCPADCKEKVGITIFLILLVILLLVFVVVYVVNIIRKKFMG